MGRQQADRHVAVGDTVEHKWQGQWYPVTCIGRPEDAEDRILIHYDGWSESWDQWVDVNVNTCKARPGGVVEFNGLARVRATFGAPDLALAAAASGAAAAGRAGADADEAALRPVVTAVARAWRHGNVRVLSGAARGARTLGSAARAAARGAPPPAGGDLTVVVAPTCVEITIYGAFVLNQRDVLHAIDATPARWRGGVGLSPLDSVSMAVMSPRNDFVMNYRAHPTQ